MATNFPTNLDTLTNPSGTDKVTSPDHAKQHTDKNDAIEAIEAKVGKDGSTVNSSHDRKLSNVTGSDKAVSLTGTETLTNKTLTSPKVNILFDIGGNESLRLPATGSAINDLTITNAAAGGDILVQPSGGDTDVGLKIKGKGSDKVKLGDAELQWPDSDGSANQVIKTNGSAVLSFADSSTGPSCVTLIPLPNFLAKDLAEATFANNTSATFGQIVIPFQIAVNKLSILSSTKTTSGDMVVAIYSEDGQTKLIEETFTISANNTVYTNTLSAEVVLDAGIYYVAAVSIGGTSTTMSCWVTQTANGLGNLRNAVTGEPRVDALLTVSAGTLPATITPATLTASDNNKTLVIRLDN